jgi:TolB-like protein/DNA-binding winged helix-turn-helix (wHTH) protein/Flp pilus assembly protein TadD
MKSQTQARGVRFGAFEIDLRTGELRKHGIRIKLQDQPFQILALLLDRPGEIVTREELRRELWPEDTFVDFDVGLNAGIRRLRDALGDSAEGSRYIETLPRKGYRFVASVERIEDSAAHTENEGEQPAKRQAVLRRREFWFVSGAAAAILVLLFGLNVGGLRRQFLRTPPKIQSIAVLPLENLSGDSSQEYFADGMTEALTTDLGKIGQLRVVSRTSAARYKGAKKSLQEIARELQVDALVEGTVARSGDRVRVTANLVQVSPEKHLWADSFERDIRNVLQLQDDASRAIADAIQIRLTPEEQARLNNAHFVDPEAYEAYLEARYYREPGSEMTKKSREYYELAITKDPTWALPYAGLAETDWQQGQNHAIPNEMCGKAKDEALEALKRDNEAAEAHTALADEEFFCEWDWGGAEREIRRAIELNPNFAQAHASYGHYLWIMGRPDEALAETRRAVEFAPLEFPARWSRYLSLYMLGRYDEALEECRKLEEFYPDLDNSYLYCGDVYVQRGSLEEGIRKLEKADALADGKHARVIAHLGYAYALAGRKNDAQNTVARLKELSRHQAVLPVLVAEVYAGLGQKEDAFERLEEGYRGHGRDLLEMKYNPQFATLRSDPRFIDLVRRIGLPH